MFVFGSVGTFDSTAALCADETSRSGRDSAAPAPRADTDDTNDLRSMAASVLTVGRTIFCNDINTGASASEEARAPREHNISRIQALAGSASACILAAPTGPEYCTRWMRWPHASRQSLEKRHGSFAFEYARAR